VRARFGTIVVDFWLRRRTGTTGTGLRPQLLEMLQSGHQINRAAGSRMQGQSMRRSSSFLRWRLLLGEVEYLSRAESRSCRDDPLDERVVESRS